MSFEDPRRQHHAHEASRSVRASSFDVALRLKVGEEDCSATDNPWIHGLAARSDVFDIYLKSALADDGSVCEVPRGGQGRSLLRSTTQTRPCDEAQWHATPIDYGISA